MRLCQTVHRVHHTIDLLHHMAFIPLALALLNVFVADSAPSEAESTRVDEVLRGVGGM